MVVCIPGGPGLDPERYYAPLQFPGYELLILAPRGTGRSSSPPGSEGYRMAGYVEDVESLREHLGLQTIVLYGHSHGGMVALAYACAHPARVERVVISAAPARMDESYREAMAATKERFATVLSDGAERIAAADKANEELDTLQDAAELRRAFRTLMSRYVVRHGSDERSYLDALAAAPMNWVPLEVMYEEMMGGLDLLRGAEAVTAPALVIAGELDVTAPPESVRPIAEALPNATYAEFAGVGHFVEVEDSEAFVRTAADFLAS